MIIPNYRKYPLIPEHLIRHYLVNEVIIINCHSVVDISSHYLMNDV